MYMFIIPSWLINSGHFTQVSLYNHYYINVKKFMELQNILLKCVIKQKNRDWTDGLLRQSCNDTVPPHMGHVHLLELFQSNINDSELSNIHM